MKLKQSENLVEMQSPRELWDPYVVEVNVCRLKGEEEQDIELLPKDQLCFLSGELIPKCWLDSHYRDSQWAPHRHGGSSRSSHADFNYYGA